MVHWPASAHKSWMTSLSACDNPPIVLPSAEGKISLGSITHYLHGWSTALPHQVVVDKTHCKALGKCVLHWPDTGRSGWCLGTPRQPKTKAYLCKSDLQITLPPPPHERA